MKAHLICKEQIIRRLYAKPFVLIRCCLTHHMVLISGINLQASAVSSHGIYSQSGVDAHLGAWHPRKIMPMTLPSGVVDWATFLIFGAALVGGALQAGLSVVKLCLMALSA